MRNYKKIIVIASMALVLGSTSKVYAANTFKFDFISNIIGKTEFKLKGKYTTCDSKADTCVYNTHAYAGFIGKYCIDLDGNGFWNPNYNGKYKKADGYVHTTDYKNIKKNTYTVNIGSNSHLASRGGIIRGTGKIIQ